MQWLLHGLFWEQTGQPLIFKKYRHPELVSWSFVRVDLSVPVNGSKAGGITLRLAVRNLFLA